MHVKVPFLAIALLALPFAGCLDSGDGGAKDGADAGGDPAPTSDPSSAADPSNASAPPPREPRANESRPDPEAPPPPKPKAEPAPWPPLGAASVRPGVQVVADASQCTSNFLFRSPDNATLYLGLAAHCVADGGSSDTNGCLDPVKPMAIGSAVQIEGASKPGRLAYTSWGAMRAAGEKDDETCAFNDFALIAIDPADRASVHPAMLRFGGPTALADSSSVLTGDKVLTYGNSGMRFGVEPSNWHEGYVVWGSAWSNTVYTAPPGVPGDSGSGVLLGNGQALGVVVTIAGVPPAANGVTSLDRALAYAKEHGMHAEIVTFRVLDPGLLPGL